MSGQDDDTEKTFDATEQKLLEARRKGEIAKSNDLMTAAAYGGLLLALVMSGQNSIREFGTILMTLLDQAADLGPLFVLTGVSPLMGGLFVDLAKSLMPFFAFPAIGVILAVFAQRAWVFAPSKLAAKMSRISPLSNAKNKFGRSGLFEFAKSFVKLCIYSISLTYFIYLRTPDMMAALQTSPNLVMSLLAKLCVGFLSIVVLIATAIGGIDAIWQHFEHLRKNMMSRKEITDEAKNSEGDPHLKQERRQRAMAASQNQMMGDVPKADVIIVNPTHYAVALQWSRAPGEAPVCVAKGVDEIARAIREAGSEAGVPLHSDPPTARSLYATTEIGQEIAPEHFQAVAAAIRFAQNMRERAKGRI